MKPAETVLDLTKTKEERIQAAFALENSANPEYIRALCKGLEQDPSPVVRHEYAFSLGECAWPEIAGPALIKAIKEDDSIFVVHESLLALATLAKPEFIPFVEKYLDDSRPDIAESAEIALQRLHFANKRTS